MDEETPLECQAKLRFTTRRDAEAAATVAEHQHGIKLKAYMCRHCGWWHLSSI